MFLSKLIGYDEISDQYRVDGTPTELPISPFVVGYSVPDGYSDFSDKPENWWNYSKSLISPLIVGFKDILNVRSVIKPLITDICGDDFSGWDSLTAEQQVIALSYFPTKIIGAQGFIFFATKSGGALQANNYIDGYQDLSEPIRRVRYNALSKFVYGHLWKENALQAERLAQLLALDVSYVRRGVVFKSEDDVDGLGDWLQSTNGFSLTGLKAKINLGDFTIKTGLPLDTFIDTCVGIINDGIY